MRLVLSGLAGLLVTACNDSHAGGAKRLADQPLEAYRLELLDLAFTAASKLPLNPHLKNRSRLQAEVVTACLELDQPLRASRYVEEIEDWRRGAGYGELAFYCAQHGHAPEAPRYLERARSAADAANFAGGENAQDWQRDAIRARIAQTYLWLGDEQAAAPFTSVVDSEAAAIMTVRAERVPAEEFDEHVRELDALIATGSFDQVRSALDGYARLYARFYPDAERRARIAQALRAASQKLPPQVRVELWAGLAESALENADQATALALVNEAQQELESFRWTPALQVPLAARLAALRFRAGDTEKARTDAAAARALFAAERAKIVDVFRAEALIPLAEAHAAMGERAAALAVYAQALEEATVNPNSRPRAEDYVALCCSLAVTAVEPDAVLLARLREVWSSLGDPW